MSSYPLSDKAKGKQRAVETLENNRSTSALPKAPPAEDDHLSRDLVVRFTEGFPDLTVTVEKEDFVRDVKRKVLTDFFGNPALGSVVTFMTNSRFMQIREARPELENRRLRLIQSGRLLTDGTFLYAWLVSLEEKQQRANIETTEIPDKTATTWIHCSVGPKSEKNEAGEDEKEQVCLLHGV